MLVFPCLCLLRLGSTESVSICSSSGLQYQGEFDPETTRYQGPPLGVVSYLHIHRLVHTRDSSTDARVKKASGHRHKKSEISSFYMCLCPFVFFILLHLLVCVSCEQAINVHNCFLYCMLI